MNCHEIYRHLVEDLYGGMICMYIHVSFFRAYPCAKMMLPYMIIILHIQNDEWNTVYIYIYDWLNINKFLRVYCLVNHYIPSRDKRTKQKYEFKTSIPDSSIRQQAFSKVWIKELKVLNLGEHLVALGRRSYDQTARCLENLWEAHPSCSFDVVYCETFGLRGS